MILAKIHADGFVDAVGTAPLIAFQALQHGYAVATPEIAYYAPINHPGGGNLDPKAFADRLGAAFIHRMVTPARRTLRPTAQPTPIVAMELNSISGDDPVMVEFATQVVIQAIEEHDRPELKATMDSLKLDMMIDALDLVIDHAGSARGLCETGDAKPMQIRLHLMQSVQAMKTALEMMLKP